MIISVDQNASSTTLKFSEDVKFFLENSNFTESNLEALEEIENTGNSVFVFTDDSMEINKVESDLRSATCISCKEIDPLISLCSSSNTVEVDLSLLPRRTEAKFLKLFNFMGLTNTKSFLNYLCSKKHVKQ